MTSDLKQLKREIRRAANHRVRDAARAVAADAKMAAPVDTGHLKSQIRSRRQRQAHWFVDCGNAWYATFPEFGSVHNAAKPFMTPAAEAEGAFLYRRFANLLEGG